MSKRRRDVSAGSAALSTEAAADDFVLEPFEASYSSDSEESRYSGLESEPDDSSVSEGEDEDCEGEGEGDSEGEGEGEGEGEESEGASDDQSWVEEGGGRGGEEGGNDGDLVYGVGNAGGVSRTSSWREVEETDTSDEEEVRNTVGNIPLEWYDDYPHVGYTQEGARVFKPAKGDELDDFLAKMDDPNYWRTVEDKVTGKKTVLSDEELDVIKKIQSLDYPVLGYDPHQPYVDFFTHEKMDHPLSNAMKPKSSFIPSKWERKRVSKLVHAIKMGWIKPIKKPEKPKFHMLWDNTDQDPSIRQRMHIPAPKLKLPGHAESYNPPPEYLPTQQEIKEWEEMDPEDRPRNFLPHRYDSLRRVPAYQNFIKERFERCLDLYLCPRQRKMRVQVDPEDLIPKLPKPRDLQPFPTTETIVYEGHTDMVRCVSVEPRGQWLASGSDDQTLRLWEVETGRCVRTLPLPPVPPGCVTALSFCPNAGLTLLAAAVGSVVCLLNHGLGDRLLVSATHNTLLSQDPVSEEVSESTGVKWNVVRETKDGRRDVSITVEHTKPVKQVVWHYRGDYFATVMADAQGASVVIHQLSKRQSQCPFRNSKGVVQKVSFHPSKPFFFIATQTSVRVYNLAKQELTKKLLTGAKWISSIAVHPQGDNVIAGSYDKKLCWFDMDLSSKPYKVLRHHKQAVRQVCFHSCYPLFASCSDDGSVIVCHGKVFNDLMQNPQIVPVKVLKGHATVDGLSVLDCVFHPSQPWLFSAGTDHTIRLYT